MISVQDGDCAVAAKVRSYSALTALRTPGLMMLSPVPASACILRSTPDLPREPIDLPILRPILRPLVVRVARWATVLRRAPGMPDNLRPNFTSSTMLHYT